MAMDNVGRMDAGKSVDLGPQGSHDCLLMVGSSTQLACVLKGLDAQPVVHPVWAFFASDNMHLGPSVGAENALMEQEKNPAFLITEQAVPAVDAHAILLCVEHLLPEWLSFPVVV